MIRQELLLVLTGLWAWLVPPEAAPVRPDPLPPPPTQTGFKIELRIQVSEEQATVSGFLTVGVEGGGADGAFQQGEVRGATTSSTGIRGILSKLVGRSTSILSRLTLAGLSLMELGLAGGLPLGVTDGTWFPSADD
jgi:hypothetical protein